VKGLEIRDRECLQRRLGSSDAGAVAMRCAEDGARERHRRDGCGIVLGLQQRCQPFLTEPLEFCVGERRAKNHIRHQRQGVFDAGDGNVESHGRRIERRRSGQRCTEEVHRVGQLQCVARSCAFVEHRRGQAGESELAGRVIACTSLHEQIDLHERHFVRFDQPHGEAVRQHASLDLGKVEPRRGANHRRPRSIRRALCDQRGRERSDDDDDGNYRLYVLGSGAHFFASGTTTTSTRRSAGSQRIAAACTSDGLNDV
jgi:hypothetical protein